MSKTADIIRRRFSTIKDLTSDVFDRLEVNRNLYKGILNADDTYEWDYSLVDPHVFPLVRNYLSRSNPTMSSIRLDVRRNEDNEIRQVNQDFLNWEIGELMTTSLFYRQFFSAYIAGRGYIKTGWEYEKAIEVTEQDDDGKVIRTKVLRDIVNRATAKFVRYNDILVPNRNNPLLNEQPYIIEPMQITVGEMLDENQALEEKGEKPFWKKKFINKLRKSGVTSKLLDYQMDMATDADSKDELAFRAAYVSMLCMTTKDGEIFYLPIEDDDDVVNQDTESRYWGAKMHYPYIDFCPFPEDDEYYSLALVDVVGDLQIAATEILNQTLTNIRQINNDMWIAGTTAAQTPDWQFRKRPDGIIRVMGDVSQIQQIRTQDNTMPALRMSEAVGVKIERSGGISSLYSSGAPSQNINQTARGAQIIDQNIDTNMKMIIDLFGEQVIKRLGEHFLELNAQYVTEEQTIAVTGKRGVRELIHIDPEKVNANFIVSVNSEKLQKQSPASRQASLQNSIQVLQNIQSQSQGAVQIDMTPIVEALTDATPELENVEDIVISVDEKSQRDIAMLMRGQMPEIKIRDAHEDLVTAANVFFEENQELMDEATAQLFEDYVMKHLRYMRSKQEAAMMSQPQIPRGMGQESMSAAMGGFNPEMGETQGLPENDQTYNLGNIVGGM